MSEVETEHMRVYYVFRPDQHSSDSYPKPLLPYLTGAWLPYRADEPVVADIMTYPLRTVVSVEIDRSDGVASYGRKVPDDVAEAAIRAVDPMFAFCDSSSQGLRYDFERPVRSRYGHEETHRTVYAPAYQAFSLPFGDENAFGRFDKFLSSRLLPEERTAESGYICSALGGGFYLCSKNISAVKRNKTAAANRNEKQRAIAEQHRITAELAAAKATWGQLMCEFFADLPLRILHDCMTRRMPFVPVRLRTVLRYADCGARITNEEVKGWLGTARWKAAFSREAKLYADVVTSLGHMTSSIAAAERTGFVYTLSVGALPEATEEEVNEVRTRILQEWTRKDRKARKEQKAAEAEQGSSSPARSAS